MGEKKALGQWGESHAAEYLVSKGFRILDRNIRTPYGEIDLLCQQEERLVFVEVKTRTSTRFGLPEDAITPIKYQHMFESAQHYLMEDSAGEKSWRIDVVSVLKESGGKVQVEHFENVSI